MFPSDVAKTLISVRNASKHSRERSLKTALSSSSKMMSLDATILNAGIQSRKTILIHSADRDLRSSLSILLQDRYSIVTSESLESLISQRQNTSISLLVIDLEKSIPELLDEFESRRFSRSNVPIIVLYAFRMARPEWEKKIRKLANQILYKPVQTDQILNAIAIEEHLNLKV